MILTDQFDSLNILCVSLTCGLKVFSDETPPTFPLRYCLISHTVTGSLNIAAWCSLSHSGADNMFHVSPSHSVLIRGLLWGGVLPGHGRGGGCTDTLHVPLPPNQQGVISASAPTTCLITTNYFTILTLPRGGTRGIICPVTWSGILCHSNLSPAGGSKPVQPEKKRRLEQILNNRGRRGGSKERES